MKISHIAASASGTLAALAIPVLALAQDVADMPGMEMAPSPLEPAVTAGYWLATVGFFLATVVTFLAVRKYGKSTLGSIFSFLLIGTGIMFGITVYQLLGVDFFGVPDESITIWWHLLFYVAFFFYYYALKSLVGLTTQGKTVPASAVKTWGLVAIVILAIVFIVPKMAEPLLQDYENSVLFSMGLHHFIAFALAGIVGGYLIVAKKRIGQIGQSIATPMIVALWSLSFLHLWELLNESWRIIVVSGEVGEGLEKVFLIIAAVSIGYAAWRLKKASTV